MSNQPNKPARNYCFTLNNPSDELRANPATLITADIPSVRYAIWQLELGEEGTPHFQGYLELERPQRYSALSSSTNLKGAHFEARCGSREQAREYCRKEETRSSGPWEYGVWSDKSQGKRSDLEGVVASINDGATLAEIAANCPTQFIRYHRGIQALRSLVAPAPSRTGLEPVNVILFLGPPGCGKTRAIRELAGPDAYWKDNGKWWDRYESHRVVIFDDMSGSSLPYRDFKRVCDRYPYTVEFKGGSIPLCATTFYLSSCSLPDKWWNPETVREYKFQEISRRITSVRAYSEETKTFLEYESFDSFLESEHSKHY